MRRSSLILGVTILLLLCVCVLIWFAALREDKHGVLTVSFLDIGQGDSIFIEAPSGRQVLIDGGPGTSLIRELSKVMPWYDRLIDIVVATHPDADHTGGLVDMFSRYQVATVVQSSVLGNTATWKTLQKQIAAEGAKIVDAKRGQIIDLGNGAYLEVLFPDRNVPNVETNVGCVVMRLVYGKTSFMLPCDTTSAIEKYLIQLDGSALQSTVLKAAHHGSKTSSSFIFVGYVAPQYGVISRGCENSYGHPHQQTLDTFEQLEVPVLDTCKEGTITFVSDGETVEVR